MFSQKIKYFLYGSIISASCISIFTYASTDGVFGDYFQNIINDAAGCGSNTVITGFKSSPYGEQKCTTFQNVVKSVLGVSTAPIGQAVIGFNASGAPVYGDVNWNRSGTNVSYTAGNVGIGTSTPGAKLNVQGSVKIVDGTQGNGKVLTSDPLGNASWQVATGGSCHLENFQYLAMPDGGGGGYAEYCSNTLPGGWVLSGTDRCSEDGWVCTVDGERCFYTRVVCP